MYQVEDCGKTKESDFEGTTGSVPSAPKLKPIDFKEPKVLDNKYPWSAKKNTIENKDLLEMAADILMTDQNRSV